jgi:membrane protein DedA with SNARE-associated domain
LPIPEEAPIILAAILSRNGQMWAPAAILTCLGGVLVGDLVVYLLGYIYGEKVIGLPVTRRLITRQREAQIKGYFHRHGFKILVSGRFVPGFRTAAYLTAGILKLPALKLLATDLVAASISTFFIFALGYAFAHQIQSGIREAQQWVTLIVALGLAGWFLHRYYKARVRAGLPIGPPVLDSDEVPLPLASAKAPGSSDTAPPRHYPALENEDPDAAERVAPEIEPASASETATDEQKSDSARTQSSRSAPACELVEIEIKADPTQTSLESPSR